MRCRLLVGLRVPISSGEATSCVFTTSVVVKYGGFENIGKNSPEASLNFPLKENFTSYSLFNMEAFYCLAYQGSINFMKLIFFIKRV